VPSKGDPINFAERADVMVAEFVTVIDSQNDAITEMNKIISGLDQTEPIAAYNPATPYTFPTCVACTDGYTYRCIGTAVTGVNPITDTATSWVRVGGATDNLVDIGNAGTSQTLNCIFYDTFTMTCDQSTLTLAVSNLRVGRSINLVLTGADNCAITWPSGTWWPDGGLEPVFTSGVDRVVMQRMSSTVIHAASGGRNYAS